VADDPDTAITKGVGNGALVKINPVGAVTETLAAVATRRRRRHSRAHPDVLAVIALGGMLGASARYGIEEWLATSPGRVPWATLGINLSGSFLLGFLLVLLLERFPPTRLARPFLATGILGAFTTMSTYQVEIALLVKDGRVLTAITYGLGSLLAGLTLAYLGILTGRLTPARHHGVNP
jgi:CrcB protein